MSKRAIILAGGKGSRLKPYTISLPKPLVPINDKPIIEIIIEQLKDDGFDHITFTINHMAEIIKAFCGNGSKWGIKIDYSQEKKPLSTIGPIKLIKNLPDNFLLMNGDVLTDLSFSKFYEYHCNHSNLFTVSSKFREHINDYGVLVKNKEKKLISFKEKPKSNFEVSMGIYMVNKEILKLVPDNQYFGFDNLMLKMLELKMEIDVKSHNGYWLDIGRPDDYKKAISDYEMYFTKTS
jgi:NDP-mannose synthase